MIQLQHLVISQVGCGEVKHPQVGDGPCQVLASHLESTSTTSGRCSQPTLLRSFPDKLSSCSLLFTFSLTAAIMAQMCLWSVRVATWDILTSDVHCTKLWGSCQYTGENCKNWDLPPYEPEESQRQSRQGVGGWPRRRWFPTSSAPAGWPLSAGGLRGRLILLAAVTWDIDCSSKRMMVDDYAMFTNIVHQKPVEHRKAGRSEKGENQREIGRPDWRKD